MGVKITGVGAYLPNIRVTRDDWLKQMEARPRYGGIQSDYFDVPDVVHHASDVESASMMGAQACLAATKNAGLHPEEIDLVLCFSTINDRTYPKDGQSIVHIGQFSNATALDLDLACSSFQSLLKVGAAFINQGLNRRVALVCTANWVHRAIDKSQDYSPLGDGAAAVILEPDPQNSLLGIKERREERFFDFVKMDCPSLTGRCETIQFTFTDAFKEYLKSGATQVAKELLLETGISPREVSWVICHQVGTKAMRGWCRSLDIPEDRLLSSYLETGNCMASNMPLVLEKYLIREPKIRRGDILLFYALSSGYHASALLWRY